MAINCLRLSYNLSVISAPSLSHTCELCFNIKNKQCCFCLGTCCEINRSLDSSPLARTFNSYFCTLRNRAYVHMYICMKSMREAAKHMQNNNNKGSNKDCDTVKFSMSNFCILLSYSLALGIVLNLGSEWGNPQPISSTFFTWQRCDRIVMFPWVSVYFYILRTSIIGITNASAIYRWNY